QGHPLLDENGSPTVAISQPDGTFTFWDSWPTGGTVTVEARIGSKIARATGFEEDVLTSKSPLPALKYYRNRITVNIAFPLDEGEVPPTEPELEILLMKGDRIAPGFVLAGTPLLVRLR